ncbi:MAG: putative metal-binding motif-containing protein, partial [Fimbriimonadaceae bacterium]|nr:putative metal-binding motif-containing protein [Chitinophagales bacterium]
MTDSTYTTWYADADGDGFGNSNDTTSSTIQPAGYVLNGDDCDDTNPIVYPGETWGSRCDEYNGYDDDCDGFIDEDGMLAWYIDNDEDGYGDPEDIDPVYSNCAEVPGHVTNNIDCDDTNYELNPGAWETCNNMDDNCNEEIDEDVQIEWHADIDQDGFGNFAITVFSCTYPDPAIHIYSHWVQNDNDCYDEEPLSHPGMPELCDGIDNNCDGAVDFNTAVYYPDLDHDYYGDINAISACDQSAYNNPDWIWDEQMYGGDCDDTNADIPSVFNNPEICNGLDDNCDGQIDEGSDYVYYWDADGDGYGGPSSPFFSLCPTPPANHVIDNTDCFEGDATIHPGATEVCNFYDDDCNGIANDITWYLDNDGDGYGNPDIINTTCPMPVNYVANNLDCNDSNAIIYPAAFEYCDGFDNDCDGSIDEDYEVSTFYFDGDNDSYGNPLNAGSFCSEEIAYNFGYIYNSNDCDDTNGNVYPFNDESCNDIDDNCNSEIDEGFNKEWHADIDHDGYGNFAITAISCSYPD